MQIATKEKPLRPSALGKLMQCNFSVANDMDDTGSGPAADTGSLVHAGIAKFHLSNDTKEGLDALRDSNKIFPLGDEELAIKHYAAYTQYRRNADAVVVGVEESIEFFLEPAPEDPTQEKIWIRGTRDQVRLENGIPRVWDVKTGRGSGYPIDMVRVATLQLAAYTLGSPNTEPGGVIRTAAYLPKSAGREPDGVFMHLTLTREQCHRLLDSVRHTVARIRAGIITVNPGSHCNWCPFGSPEMCLRRLPLPPLPQPQAKRKSRKKAVTNG